MQGMLIFGDPLVNYLNVQSMPCVRPTKNKIPKCLKTGFVVIANAQNVL